MIQLNYIVISYVLFVIGFFVFNRYFKTFHARGFATGFLSAIAFVIIASALLGCTNKMPSIVDVAVPVKTNPVIIPDKPYLPIASLTEKNSPDEVLKAYIVSVKLLTDYSDEMRSTLIEIDR